VCGRGVRCRWNYCIRVFGLLRDCGGLSYGVVWYGMAGRKLGCVDPDIARGGTN
jgi:hypothetical protein